MSSGSSKDYRDKWLLRYTGVRLADKINNKNKVNNYRFVIYVVCLKSVTYTLK
jgi:hypothetical protein